MIPNIIHFIYVGGRPFSFIHFLAVYTAWKVNRPERIFFHHSEEPSSPWWEQARPYLTLNRIDPVREIFGNPVTYPAHQADVIRLRMLRRYGGIYLDLDVICLNPFAPLLQNEFVMGIEPGTGLCNAVILARHDAEFMRLWWEEYRNFDGSRWNYHSVVLPWQLARRHPQRIHMADKYAFFYPTHNDPAHRYLWGGRPSMGEVALRLAKNVARLAGGLLQGGYDTVHDSYYRTFHTLCGMEWHYRRARASYCLHLWEGLWGEPYLKAVTPEYLRNADTNFARLLRNVIDTTSLDALAPQDTASASTAAIPGLDTLGWFPKPTEVCPSKKKEVIPAGPHQTRAGLI